MPGLVYSAHNTRSSEELHSHGADEGKIGGTTLADQNRATSTAKSMMPTGPTQTPGDPSKPLTEDEKTKIRKKYIQEADPLEAGKDPRPPMLKMAHDELANSGWYFMSFIKEGAVTTIQRYLDDMKSGTDQIITKTIEAQSTTGDVVESTGFAQWQRRLIDITGMITLAQRVWFTGTWAYPFLNCNSWGELIASVEAKLALPEIAKSSQSQVLRARLQGFHALAGLGKGEPSPAAIVAMNNANVAVAAALLPKPGAEDQADSTSRPAGPQQSTTVTSDAAKGGNSSQATSAGASPASAGEGTSGKGTYTVTQIATRDEAIANLAAQQERAKNLDPGRPVGSGRVTKERGIGDHVGNFFGAAGDLAMEYTVFPVFSALFVHHDNWGTNPHAQEPKKDTRSPQQRMEDNTAQSNQHRLESAEKIKDPELKQDLLVVLNDEVPLGQNPLSSALEKRLWDFWNEGLWNQRLLRDGKERSAGQYHDFLDMTSILRSKVATARNWALHLGNRFDQKDTLAAEQFLDKWGDRLRQADTLWHGYEWDTDLLSAPNYDALATRISERHAKLKASSRLDLREENRLYYLGKLYQMNQSKRWAA